MPYKDKEKQKMAVRKAKRKSRGYDEGMTECEKGMTGYDKDDEGMTSDVKPLTSEDVVVLMETVLSLRPAVVPDAIYKMFNELKSAVDVLTGRIAELEDGDKVDFSRLKKSGKSDSVATETGLCPKHKRIRIPGRPSCC